MRGDGLVDELDNDFKRRAEERSKRITVRVFRSWEEENAASDEFWAAMTPEQRVELLWDMVLDLDAWRGGSGDQPRLQRSVVRIRRR